MPPSHATGRADAQRKRWGRTAHVRIVKMWTRRPGGHRLLATWSIMDYLSHLGVVRGVNLPSYLRYDAVALPHIIGKNEENGTRVSTGVAGHLSFGPYCSLGSGDYVAGFYVRRLASSGPGRIDMDVCGPDLGQIALRHFPDHDIYQSVAGLIYAEFSIPAPLNNIEVRLYIPEGVRVELHELVIFNTRSRGWGGQ